MNVSIIIPAYNEESAIESVLRDIKVALALDKVTEYELIVINDGSKDNTEECARLQGVQVINNPINVGYGFSLMRGIRAAKYEYVVIMDADGTYPANKVKLLLDELDRGFDMVVGAREGRAYWSSFSKSFFRLIFRLLAEFVVGKRIPDINSGFRAFRKSKIEPILPQLSKTFSFTTSVTLIFFLKSYFIKYVPVQYARRTGKTKVHHFHDSLKALQIMIDIIVSYNPIKLFLIIAGLIFLISVLLLVFAFVFSASWLFALSVHTFVGSVLILSLGFFANMFRTK